MNKFIDLIKFLFLQRFDKLLLFFGFLLIVASSISIDMEKFQIKPSGNPSYPVLAIGGILLVLSLILLLKKNKSEDSKQIETEENKQIETEENKYYIGIDLGRYKLDCCIIQVPRNGKIIPLEYSYQNITNFVTKSNTDMISNINKAISKIFAIACEKGVSIDGIGFGLPGQINPNEGKLIHSPGFRILQTIYFYKDTFEISSSLSLKEGKKFFIAIDNDVRCAMRYFWKTENLKDSICIFAGSGLGSSIVADGAIYYGSGFAAGEVGHTTISGCFEKDKYKEGKPPCFDSFEFDCDTHGKKIGCNCQRGDKCFHIESIISSNGMLRIAKYIDDTFFEGNKIKEMLDNLIDDKYKYLYKINFPGYSDYIIEDIAIKIAMCLKGEEKIAIMRLIEEASNNRKGSASKELATKVKDAIKQSLQRGDYWRMLSTYSLSLAYYNGDKYAGEVLKLFNEYFSIVIANYIHILNPKSIYLGGGMIKGFYKKGQGTDVEDDPVDLLKNNVKNYLLDAAKDFSIELKDDHLASSAGAAAIFVDESYLERLKNKQYHQVVYRNGKLCNN